jgi:hypothetical protein
MSNTKATLKNSSQNNYSRTVQEQLTDEQMKDINFFLNIESDKKMIEEKKHLNFTVNVITTYEDREQEQFDIKIKHILPSQICSMNTEADVLYQVLYALEEIKSLNLDYLVKISMCYNTSTICGSDGEYFTRGTEVVDEVLKSLHLFDVINRCRSKYYFQPNQRDIVVNAALCGYDNAHDVKIASKTKNYDKEAYVEDMQTSPRYIKGKELVDEMKSLLNLKEAA